MRKHAYPLFMTALLAIMTIAMLIEHDKKHEALDQLRIEKLKSLDMEVGYLQDLKQLSIDFIQVATQRDSLQEIVNNRL